MENFELTKIRAQLNERRSRLKEVISGGNEPQHLITLLQKVDSALERMDIGTYGFCANCHDPIEEDRLRVDPLITVCLDHLSESEQKTLEQDLILASRIQTALLPKNNFTEFGFDVSYHYQPAGPVSGDYCDIVVDDKERNIFFVMGDISGKGIAASMLMTHIHALIHSLIGANLSVDELMEKANRIFCESALYSHFITMICGRTGIDGDIQIANAGHCMPVVIQKNGLINLDSTGMPLGVFQSGKYTTSNIRLDYGETILLYTDGLSEANLGDNEYGIERINQVAKKNFNISPKPLINCLLNDVSTFTQGARLRDDLSIMAIHRKGI
jgi:sigma-B regulation protein RsbU (phosphoserine phosphatase)